MVEEQGGARLDRHPIVFEFQEIGIVLIGQANLQKHTQVNGGVQRDAEWDPALLGDVEDVATQSLGSKSARLVQC